jgi:Xaa-Pro aminopeptidase
VGYEGSFETVAGSHIGGEVTVPSTKWKTILTERFPASTFRDLTDPIYRERIVKTDDELQRIRLTNLIASDALDTIIPQVRPGLKECQVAAMVESAVESQGYGFRTALRARGFAFVQSGPVNSANGWWPFSISSERVIEKGDSILIELDAYADGYWCDLTRSFVVGTESQDQSEMRTEVQAARDKVLQALRPERVTCAQLDTIARQSLQKRFPANAFPHKIGHGVGFAFHELPLLHPSVHDEVPVGAVLAIEPGLYITGIGGYRLEDNVYVGKGGFEVLSTARVP